ncbi:nucleotidyltransferase family protein [Methanobacterium alkalithermotolerans]|uniref:protein adenylyltransferase n=1 Tax=Methanobacterium alkalithermotolerans TaxID=2731220 RepID=A0A8T8K3C0_9EURY|nr:nucleotidyltransferase family protein [Methanobacterium alkalithermotolerans]QUH22432.1 nucleotidyltransferase family protein [Methanobacterium alkalithermotolerans]
MEKEEILKLIRNLNPQIQDKYNAQIKAIFGSYVRGEETPDSDLDVLVEFNESANLLDLVELSQFLEDEIHINIDVVPIDTVRKEIKKQVMKEAILV